MASSAWFGWDGLEIPQSIPPHSSQSRELTGDMSCLFNIVMIGQNPNQPPLKAMKWLDSLNQTAISLPDIPVHRFINFYQVINLWRHCYKNPLMGLICSLVLCEKRQKLEKFTSIGIPIVTSLVAIV